MIQCFTCASEIRSIVVDFISIFFYLIFIIFGNSTFDELLYFDFAYLLNWRDAEKGSLLTLRGMRQVVNMKINTHRSSFSQYNLLNSVYQINRHNK